MKPLYKQYENTKAVGYLPLSNWGGLEILNINDEIDDRVVACFNYGTSRQQIRHHKIYYSASGRAYIRKQNTRYYFDEIIKV